MIGPAPVFVEGVLADNGEEEDVSDGRASWRRRGLRMMLITGTGQCPQIRIPLDARRPEGRCARRAKIESITAE